MSSVSNNQTDNRVVTIDVLRRFHFGEPAAASATSLPQAGTLPALLQRLPGLRRLPPWHFDAQSAARALNHQFGTRDLSGFGCQDMPLAVGAAGALLQYVKDTQRAALPHLRGLRTEQHQDSVVMDAATRRNLEIDTSQSGNREHSLLTVLDKTVTAMGGRMLRRRLHRPLRDRKVLAERHQCVESLLQARLFEALHDQLRGSSDLERILSRVALKSARPRDLSALRDTLARLPELQALLRGDSDPLLGRLSARIQEHPGVVELLSKALPETPPALLRDGGVFAPGYDAELDELRRLSEQSDQVLLEMETQERERSGVSNLRIRYNRVHGYYIEVSRAQADRVPDNYQRRQTLKGAERFVTPELKQHEDRVLGARSKALEREKLLYEALLEQLLAVIQPLSECAESLAELDVLATLAERAETLNWSRPELVDKSCIAINAGRHPVIEHFTDDPFVPNDVTMVSPARRLLVITGPNMSGKSTYLRQTALANPHVAIRYKDPKGEVTEFPRATESLPEEAEEIKPHPYGVELGMLMRILKDSKARNLRGMKTLQSHLEPGYCLRAARILNGCRGNILIGTGFPVVKTFETDGPVGAVGLLRGEFWPKQRSMYHVKQVACAAHTYGRTIVDAESFTSWRHWRDSPYYLKLLVDQAFVDGLDRGAYSPMLRVDLSGHRLHLEDLLLACVAEIEALNPERIVVSPGPCTPDESGICNDVIRAFRGRIPILGVCLGHQSIAQAFGGRIVHSPRVMHGKTSMIHHDGRSLYRGIDDPFEATRYHSLMVYRSDLPACLEISSWTRSEDGGMAEIMGLRHRELPLEGVQFHPESILTQHGHDMLKNFLDM